MKGSIIGDIIGSRFEFNNTKSKNFKLFTKECDFTDDTICTVAIMDAILSKTYDYKTYLLKWCRRYPNPKGAYGASFNRWLYSSDPRPYNSFGNGAAMRVAPVGWAFNVPGEAISHAIATANISHNHPEGIKGAIATVQAIVGLRAKKRREYTTEILHTFYDPTIKYNAGVFDETCQGTVPVALHIIATTNGFEEAIRETMAWGGDSDTLGAIVGGMAEALYGIPKEIECKAMEYLPSEMQNIVDKFYNKYVL